MAKNYKIYILLSHSGSMFSKAINICTRGDYTHVSIGLDSDLKELYSFGRLKPNNPLFAGFVKEDIINGTYGRFPHTRCRLYSLKINEIQYKKLQNELERFKKEADKYGYNFLGVISAYFNHPLKRKYNYFCSQFVAELLHKCGIILLDKEPALTAPMDFIDCDQLEFIYEGYLNAYSQKQKD